MVSNRHGRRASRRRHCTSTILRKPPRGCYRPAATRRLSYDTINLKIPVTLEFSRLVGGGQKIRQDEGERCFFFFFFIFVQSARIGINSLSIFHSQIVMLLYNCYVFVVCTKGYFVTLVQNNDRNEKEKHMWARLFEKRQHWSLNFTVPTVEGFFTIFSITIYEFRQGEGSVALRTSGPPGIDIGLTVQERAEVQTRTVCPTGAAVCHGCSW